VATGYINWPRALGSVPWPVSFPIEDRTTGCTVAVDTIFLLRLCDPALPCGLSQPSYPLNRSCRGLRRSALTMCAKVSAIGGMRSSAPNALFWPRVFETEKPSRGWANETVNPSHAAGKFESGWTKGSCALKQKKKKKKELWLLLCVRLLPLPQSVVLARGTMVPSFRLILTT